jgi:hypothetical protein
MQEHIRVRYLKATLINMTKRKKLDSSELVARFFCHSDKHFGSMPKANFYYKTLLYCRNSYILHKAKRMQLFCFTQKQKSMLNMAERAAATAAVVSKVEVKKYL